MRHVCTEIQSVKGLIQKYPEFGKAEASLILTSVDKIIWTSTLVKARIYCQCLYLDVV
jgi:hypothetical protein